jgi:hypothetical protein
MPSRVLPAKSYKESYATCNAIADCAKAREVDEKTLS